LLNGSWLTGNLGSFSFANSGDFTLAGGALTSLLDFKIDTASIGLYNGYVDLKWYGSNGDIPGFTDTDKFIRLNLVANVVSSSVVPEPGVLWLFGGAGLGWMVSRRKKAATA
jgi:hypothetical protein